MIDWIEVVAREGTALGTAAAAASGAPVPASDLLLWSEGRRPADGLAVDGDAALVAVLREVSVL